MPVADNNLGPRASDPALTPFYRHCALCHSSTDAFPPGFLRGGDAALKAAQERIGPFTIMALLSTLVLLFAFQGEAIVEQPLIIGMLAVPIFLQGLLIAALGYWLNRKFRVQHDVRNNFV